MGTLTCNQTQAISFLHPDTVTQRTDPSELVTPTIKTCGVAVAFDRYGTNNTDVIPTLMAGSPTQAWSGHTAVAYDIRGREGGAQMEGPSDTASVRSASGGSTRSYIHDSVVRRLTPVECERLQGFPDKYTDVTYRGKPSHDGPRYRALGNAMCVPVMRFILERMQTYEERTGVAA